MMHKYDGVMPYRYPSQKNLKSKTLARIKQMQESGIVSVRGGDIYLLKDFVKIIDAINAIRKSDCGAWLKDCDTFNFRCSEGREKRIELSRLLDGLYKASNL